MKPSFLCLNCKKACDSFIITFPNFELWHKLEQTRMIKTEPGLTHKENWLYCVNIFEAYFSRFLSLDDEYFKTFARQE